MRTLLGVWAEKWLRAHTSFGNFVSRSQVRFSLVTLKEIIFQHFSYRLVVFMECFYALPLHRSPFPCVWLLSLCAISGGFWLFEQRRKMNQFQTSQYLLGFQLQCKSFVRQAAKGCQACLSHVRIANCFTDHWRDPPADVAGVTCRAQYARTRAMHHAVCDAWDMCGEELAQPHMSFAELRATISHLLRSSGYIYTFSEVMGSK